MRLQISDIYLLPAARDAPTAPPSLSANVSSMAKFSLLFKPLPPDTTTVNTVGNSMYMLFQQHPIIQIMQYFK